MVGHSVLVVVVSLPKLLSLCNIESNHSNFGFILEMVPESLAPVERRQEMMIRAVFENVRDLMISVSHRDWGIAIRWFCLHNIIVSFQHCVPLDYHGLGSTKKVYKTWIGENPEGF
jgi:hypothetical protein